MDMSGSATGQMGGQWHHTNSGIHIFLLEGGMRTMNWVQGFLYVRESLSAVKRAEFVNDSMSYIVLRGAVFILLL
jgi:hypothetical protein